MWNWLKEIQLERERERLVTELLTAAFAVGLPPRDYSNALDMLGAGESGVAFDIIVQQLYEHDIEIPTQLFMLAKQVGDSMLLTPGSFFFLGELIRSPSHIPVPVRKSIVSLVDSLRSFHQSPF